MAKSLDSSSENVMENSSDEEKKTPKEDSSEESNDSELDEHVDPVKTKPNVKEVKGLNPLDYQVKMFKIGKQVIKVYSETLESKINTMPILKLKDVKFFTPTALRNTQNSKIHDDTPVYCSVCHKVCSSKEELRSHKTVHTRELTTCKKCGKILSSKENLRIHDGTHTGERPFNCSICGRDFAQRQTMKIHENTHRPDKPFQCSKCARQFKSEVIRNSHMKKCGANGAVQSQVTLERSIDQTGIFQVSLQQNVNPSQLPIQNADQVVPLKTDNLKSRTNKKQESKMPNKNHHLKNNIKKKEKE